MLWKLCQVQVEANKYNEDEIPLGEMGDPNDIADGCLYLASDESKYVTGTELVIDGGFTCR